MPDQPVCYQGKKKKRKASAKVSRSDFDDDPEPELIIKRMRGAVDDQTEQSEPVSSQDNPSSQSEPITRIPLNDTALQYMAQSAAEQESIPTTVPQPNTEDVKVESSSQPFVKEEESSSQPLSMSGVIQSSSQPLSQENSDSQSTDFETTPKTS